MHAASFSSRARRSASAPPPQQGGYPLRLQPQTGGGGFPQRRGDAANPAAATTDPYDTGDGTQTTRLTTAPPAAPTRSFTVATFNVTGSLESKYPDIVRLLKGADLVAITETHLQNHNFVTALRSRGVYIITVNRAVPSAALTAPNIPQRGSGGVAFLALSNNICLRTLDSHPCGVLTVEASFKDARTERIVLTVVYVPPRSSVSPPTSARFTTLRSEVHHVLGEHVRRHAARAPDRYLVLGDFNDRLCSSESYSTNDPCTSDRCTTATLELFSSLGLWPVHGSTDAPRAHTTSVSGQMQRRVAQGVPLPPTQSTATHFVIVDYILAPPTAPNITPLPTVPWAHAAALSTHRPVFARVDLSLGPAVPRRPVQPSLRLPFPPPYGSTAYADLAAAITGRLDAGPLRNVTDSTPIDADTALGELNNAITESVQETIPRSLGVLESAAAVTAATARSWPQKDRVPLAAGVVALLKKCDALRDKRDTAIRYNRQHMAHKFDRALRETQRLCRRLSRALGRSQEERVLAGAEQLRYTDRHALHKLLQALAPATAHAGDTDRLIPNRDDGTPATITFPMHMKDLYATPKPAPPAMAPGSSSFSDVPVAPGNHTWLVAPVKAADVHLVLYPHHYDVQPSVCVRGCALCKSYIAQQRSHRASSTVDAPSWSPHIHTSKSPGPDGIRAEWYCWARPDTDGENPHANHVYRMRISNVIAAAINDCLRTGSLPELSVKNRTMPLFKTPKTGQTADASNPSDYRFLTIGNVLAKVTDLVLTSRLSHWAAHHRIPGPEQIGFKERHSCEWHVWTLVETIKHKWRLNEPAYVLFVDLKKAYDMVHPDAILAVLKKMGIPDQFSALLEDKFKRRVTAVSINGAPPDEMPMCMGVGQGDVLAPLLFNLFIASLNHKLASTPGLTGVRITSQGAGPKESILILDLFYADDLAITCNSPAECQLALDTVRAWCKDWGMELSANKGKTEAMAFPPPRAKGVPAAPSPPPLSNGSDGAVQWTPMYKYLGYHINCDLNDSQQFSAVVQNMHAAWSRYFVTNQLMWAASPALLTETFRTYVLGSANYLLSVVSLPSHAERGIDRLIKTAATWSTCANTSPPTSELLIQSRSLPACDLATRETVRLLVALKMALFRDSLAPTLLRILETHPGGTGACRSWISRITACVRRTARPAPGLNIAVPAIHPQRTPSQQAATYARAIAYERAKRELISKLARNGIAPQPRSVTSHIRPGTLAGGLDLAGGLPHEPIALGSYKGRTPISVHSPGGSAGLLSMATISRSRRSRNTLTALITALRLGALGLHVYPAAPTLYRTPLGNDSDEWDRWKKQAHGDTRCTLCDGPATPLHVLCHCTSPPVVAARDAVYDRVPAFVERLAEHLCEAQMKGALPWEKPDIADAALRVAAIRKAAHAADRDGDDWVYAVSRLFLVSTLSTAAIADTPADVPCELSSLLGELMDSTYVGNRYLRRTANSWVSFAAHATSSIVDAWSAAVDADAGLDHGLSRLDALDYAKLRPRAPRKQSAARARAHSDNDSSESSAHSSSDSGSQSSCASDGLAPVDPDSEEGSRAEWHPPRRSRSCATGHQPRRVATADATGPTHHHPAAAATAAATGTGHHHRAGAAARSPSPAPRQTGTGPLPPRRLAHVVDLSNDDGAPLPKSTKPKWSTADVVKAALNRPLSASDARVLDLFGLTAAEGQQCYDLLSHVSPLGSGVLDGRTLAAHLGTPATNQLLPDGDLQSLTGDILDDVLTQCMRLVPTLIPADGRRALHVFDSKHSVSMLPMHDDPNDVTRTNITNLYHGKHVDDKRKLLVATNPGGHWTLNIVDNVSNTICTLDPLPGNNGGGMDDETRCARGSDPYRIARRNRMTRNVLEAFLVRERVRLKAPARPSRYTETVKPANLSTQNDSTSCGAFVFAYAYFLLIHGRHPTPADFTGANHLALRLVMLHACVTGTLRRGALPGGAAAAGGAATA